MGDNIKFFNRWCNVTLKTLISRIRVSKNRKGILNGDTKNLYLSGIVYDGQKETVILELRRILKYRLIFI